jgi:hypothetical protein
VCPADLVSQNQQFPQVGKPRREACKRSLP